MRSGKLVVACMLAAGVASPALADPAAPDLASAQRVDRLWPGVPAWHGLTMDERITDHLTDLGNLIGHRLDLLTDDVVALRVDGRGNRAWLRVGGGDARFLALHIATDWHFVGNVAEVYAHLELGAFGHKVDLALPEVELSGDSYHGQQLVVVDVPLLQRRF